VKNAIRQDPPVKSTLQDYAARPKRHSRAEGGKRFGEGSIIVPKAEGPLVSIITVVCNGGQYLEQTIKSVIGQTYGNIEYLIIDGGSTDGTLDIIRKYEDQIDYWVSESDKGISDAMNKGIASSTGEIIGLLHADDWYSPDQIERGVDALKQTDADFVFGDLHFHDSAGEFKYRINGDPGYRNIINSRMPDICHPTVLVKREAYERAGLFDTGLHVAMDYEWFLRLHRIGGEGKYVNGLLGHMRIGGVSDSSYVKALKEVRQIAIQYGQPALIADLFLIYRVMKGVVRRILERWKLRVFYDRLRTIVNPRYTPRA